MTFTQRSVVVLVGVFTSLTAAGPSGFCAGSTLTVSGTVSGSPTSVTVNGVAATLSGSTFSASIPVSVGPNTIMAVATDAAGNNSSHTITVRVGTNVTVQGTVTETGSSVSVNGIAATVSGMSFSALVPLQLGVNALTVVVTDPAGNSGTKTGSVYVARQPIAHP